MKKLSLTSSVGKWMRAACCSVLVLTAACSGVQSRTEGASVDPSEHRHLQAEAASTSADMSRMASARLNHESASVPAAADATSLQEAGMPSQTPADAMTAFAALAPADPAFTQGPFTGSAACATCHDGIVDGAGNDVSIVQGWSSTMMANAARDPLWKAKLDSELLRNPQHAEVVADKCTRCHAPMAHELSHADGNALGLAGGGISSTSPYYAAAQDGVSCTLCHQIQDKALGLAQSFDGEFSIGDQRAIFGPYQDVFTMPMQHMVGYTPQYGAHIQKSELCATCHNVKTPIIDHTGQLLATDAGHGFPEQTPYTEWKSSAYAQTASCADCHMGRTDGVVLSIRPPWLDTKRDRFALHSFVGANKLMLNMLDQYREALGVVASDFTNTLTRTDALLAGAAKLELRSSSFLDGTLEFALRVISATGHKLPTSFPSRRVVVQVQVVDSSDQVVFESGRIDETGRVVGVHSEDDLSLVEPHYDWIERPDEAQIYESVMQDTQGAVTFTLLNASSYIKDNRLLPRGADKSTLPPDIAVHGDALDDPDFQAGEDIVHYRVKPLAAGSYRLRAALLYQTVSARFARDLFATQSPAIAWFEQAYQTAPYKTTELTHLQAALTPGEPRSR